MDRVLRAVQDTASDGDDPAFRSRTDLAGSDGPFGAALEPVLKSACGDRLSDIHWFRADWQRGGALTGYATFHENGQREHAVVVKLPVPPVERTWLDRLQRAGDVAPKLWAHGDSLNGYDIAWVVMERLPHGPLGQAWGGKEFDLLAEAAGRFYRAAAAFEVDRDPPMRDWHAILKHVRNDVQRRGLPNAQRWSQALKKAHRKLDKWLAVWDKRPLNGWCHGDLHLGNALSREPAEAAGPALLIDYAKTHPGHWVEDGVYIEHLYWARRERLGGRKLCSMIARQRKALGLPVQDDWPNVANVYRALLAMGTPASLASDGDPHHVQAALELLEREVG